MFVTQTISLVTILISFPFFGGKAEEKKTGAPADSIPPVWKTHSRLMLEDQFVSATLPDLTPDGHMGFRLRNDPRRLIVAIDPDSAVVSYASRLGEVPIGPPLRQSFDDYADDLVKKTFQRQWRERSRQSINSLATAAGQTQRPVGGLTFEFPSPLPDRIQALLGPGGPALRVSGSENIRISGTSNWTNQQVGPLGQRQSLFPTLDMQQDLNIRLEGQLSDRIKVNLLQNSANQIPLANRLAINYKGDEDDVVQALDLGNTNLTLPGTQYVSYSGKNEGLFGVKATTRLGPFDWTVLASKQEGKSERASYAGGASTRKSTLRDLDYLRGIYFLLYDPTDVTYRIDDLSIAVYYDDANYANDVNAINGLALVDPTTGVDTTFVDGTFNLLNPGADQDYEILQDVYGPSFKVIKLRRPVTGNQRLAVTYTRRLVLNAEGDLGPEEIVGGQDVPDGEGGEVRRLKLLRPPITELKQDSNGNFDDNDPVTSVRHLELKNFYQLPGLRIDPNTLSLTVRKGVENPPVTRARVGGETIPYLEVLGLDNFDETSGSAVRGHDERVDGSFVQSDVRVFVDYENGTLFFFEPRPFAPRLGPDGNSFENRVSDALFRRATLTGPSGSDTEPNPTIYDKYTLQPDIHAEYFIDVEFTAAGASGEIVLGRGNLLQGSEVVTINGQQLARDTDYTVDYDLGRITLKRQLGPSDQLNVDYSFAPLFQQASRTLLGSAFRIEGREKHLGGAFMYESKGAQDLRPRLGEEPSRSIIGDLNADYTFRPNFLTRLVDRLPGVRTTTPSEFRVQAEVGASFPNPNTRNEVYIDDMEGVRDAVSLSMNAERWRYSSAPSRPIVTDPDGRVTFAQTMVELDTLGISSVYNAEVKWYSPHAVVKEVHLKPTLSIAQGAENPRQVLALSVPRRPETSAPEDSLWMGLTYVMDGVGLDLSRSQFIEVWVNDFNDYHNHTTQEPRIRGNNVQMHIEIGSVSEDQMRVPNLVPNRALDTEDKEPVDNQLVVTSENNEDTGYDGLLNAVESKPVPPDLSTVRGDDPNGDDFREPDDLFDEIDPRRFLFTNGTENNKTIRPVPDTEDLNLNNRLDTNESYFQYTIDLGDDAHPYLATDVQKEFVVDRQNGWRRYRIPIGDERRLQFGAPDLTLARHVRVWFEGIIDPNPDPATLGELPQRPLLMLASLDIVGNRWRASDIDTANVILGSTVTLNSVNTVDNADIYLPPFDPGNTRSGSQALERREQSLAVEFTELQPAQEVETFKTFSLDENYSRYGALTWFVTGFDIEGLPGVRDADSLAYYVRFASDEQGRGYYEFRSPVPLSPVTRGLAWKEERLELSEISNLKLEADFQVELDSLGTFRRPRASNPADTLIIKGRPSFTRLRRISMGMINRATGKTFSTGQVWFNELRAIDIAKDVGTAQRVSVNGRLANLMSYNFSWNGRNADFLSVGQSRGTGNTTNDFRIGTNFELHRFFEGTGVSLPVSFSYGRNTSSPRFSAGDDVVRTGVLADQSLAQSESRSWTASYSRAWGARSNPFLRYTIGGITANISSLNSSSSGPTTVGRQRTVGATVNYDLAARSLVQIPLPFTRLKLFPFPERFYWHYRVDRRETYGADRQRIGEELIERAPVIGRAATIKFGADSRPLDFFHHRFDATRNLMIDDPAFGLTSEKIGFINLGRVVQWNQTMDTRYNMNLGTWLQPNFTWSSRYVQDNRPEISRDLSVRSIGNGQSVDMRWQLPFDRLNRRATAADTTGPSPFSYVSMLLAKLGGISTNANMQWTSSYSRMTGTPDFWYLSGISDDPGLGERTLAQSDNQTSKTFNWASSARTRIGLAYGAFMQTRAEYSSQLADRNGIERRKDVARFPDVQVDYGNIAKVVRLDRFIRNPRLRTVYNRSQTTDYNLGRSIKSQVATSSQWQPLLGLSGDLNNGARLEVSLERRVTQRQSFQLGNSITTDRNTDINLSLSRSYSQGQKVSVLGRETTVRSTVNLGLTASYSRQSGETVQSGEALPRFPVERDRLSVNGRASYGFSANVTGDLNLGFGQERDLQRDIVRRNIRLELRARFTF